MTPEQQADAAAAAATAAARGDRFAYPQRARRDVTAAAGRRLMRYEKRKNVFFPFENSVKLSAKRFAFKSITDPYFL